MSEISLSPPPPVELEEEQRYVFRDLIGRGGMGEVWRAWDKELEVDVALKSLHPGASSDPRILARFRREAKLARRIKHVNVAQMYDLVEVAGARYLCMEFVHGKPLSDILQVKGALALHVAVNVFRQICSGVEAAHEAGVIHRDLKPHNIMITRRHGRACILDFGIARECGSEDLTEQGLILGSPQYMSYEQLSGEQATHRSDLYALGIVLYEMVTGVSPFRVPGATAAALRAMREVPPDPRHLEPRLPGFVASAILRCLDRDPLARFASAAELAAALEPVTTPQSPETTATIETESGPIEISDAPTALVAAPAGRDRDELVDRLGRLGLEVTVADDGSSAMDLTFSHRFTLAVVAATLAQVDGLTACQLMRRNPRCADTKLLALLGSRDVGREAFARGVGVHDVVRLPLNVHALARTVRTLLA